MRVVIPGYIGDDGLSMIIISFVLQRELTSDCCRDKHIVRRKLHRKSRLHKYIAAKLAAYMYHAKILELEQL